MQTSFRVLAMLGMIPLASSLRAAESKFPNQTLTVPDGFEVELVAGPPLVLRPMMADFDEQGRLYVADSAGSNDKVEKQLQEKPHRIVRLEDTDGDGKFDRSNVFADKLMFPEGVLWFDGAIYTGAPPTIWKLEDTDGDGVADRRTEWHQGKTLTGCANDLHGPYLGPDGWIYWCKGAFAKQTYERPGHRTISDSAAHVFRAKPNHTELDAVMSGGMDNPVEVAWSSEGELFFITTFFHHPEAGRRDAIVHCIYGGVYPKPHGVLDNLQKTGDLLPPLVELGPAAACALMRYESGAFGAEYKDNLFSTLFNLRKVMRHVLTPIGGTYSSTNEDFLVSDNPDFHPTDVLEDADGSLLVIDTGGWYKICCPTAQLAKPDVLGAIYRIRRKGMIKMTDARGLKLAWGAMKPADLARLLDDARPAVREHAIRALARQGAVAVPALSEVVRSAESVLKRRNAVWVLTRIDGPAAREAARPALDDKDESVRRTTLHSVAMHRDTSAMPRLLAFLKSGTPFEQRKAAEALGRIGDKNAVPALLDAAGTFRTEVLPKAGSSGAGSVTTDVERIQEHALIFALIEIADAESARAGLQSPNPSARRAALIALDQMDDGGLHAADVTPLFGSSNPTLRTTAEWIAGHHADWGSALAGFFRQRLAGNLSNEQDQVELQHRLAQFVRSPAIQELLAETLSSPTASRSSRLVVLHAMARSGLKEMPRGWLGQLPAALASSDEWLTGAAIAAVRAVPPPKARQSEVTEALLHVGRATGFPVALRLSALAATPGGLQEVDPRIFDLLRENLAPERPLTDRTSAAHVLARARLSDAQLDALADTLMDVGPMELNVLLESFENATNEAVGMKFVAALKEAKALSSVRVDLLRARLAKFPQSVQKAGNELLARLKVDPVEQTAHLDQLLAELQHEKSDIRRGQAIFNSPKAACSTCHAMGYLGGHVGPDLTRIGEIRTKRDLLEAVVYPSASFVRSFEPVNVKTRDGEEYTGVVRSETDDEIVLVLGASSEQRIAKSDVAEERPGMVSIMPQGLDEQLSKQELADLLAFLKATRRGP